MGEWQQGQHPDDPCHHAARYLDGLDRVVPGQTVDFVDAVCSLADESR